MLRWCKNIATIGLADVPHVGAYCARIGGDEGVVAAMKAQAFEP